MLLLVGLDPMTLLCLLLGNELRVHEFNSIRKNVSYCLMVQKSGEPVNRWFIPLFTRFRTSQVVSRISSINSRKGYLREEIRPKFRMPVKYSGHVFFHF